MTLKCACASEQQTSHSESSLTACFSDLQDSQNRLADVAAFGDSSGSRMSSLNASEQIDNTTKCPSPCVFQPETDSPHVTPRV